MWRLVSLFTENAAGTVMYPYGEDPVGMLMYTANGTMSAVLMRQGRPQFASGDVYDGTPAELKEAFEGFEAYCGTYTIDEQAGCCGGKPMSGILQDSSPAKLVTAIEENLFAWIPVFGKLGRAYANEPAGVKRSITDIPEALFNSVMDARLAPEQVDATIQFIVSDARARNVPVLWWIGPSTRPADLGKYLEKHGFANGGEEPGMAVDLMNLNESLSAPASLSIQLVQDEASWRQWSITSALGFGASSPSEHGVNAWCNVLRESNPETMLAYLGRLNDTPVATSLLFLAAGVAGVYCVATIPEARRKGIGAMMTLYPLRQARSIGYKTGVLGASEMGQGVYRSLGFQEYCKTSSYCWAPEQQVAAG